MIREDAGQEQGEIRTNTLTYISVTDSVGEREPKEIRQILGMDGK